MHYSSSCLKWVIIFGKNIYFKNLLHCVRTTFNNTINEVILILTLGFFKKSDFSVNFFPNFFLWQCYSIFWSKGNCWYKFLGLFNKMSGSHKQKENKAYFIVKRISMIACGQFCVWVENSLPYVLKSLFIGEHLIFSVLSCITYRTYWYAYYKKRAVSFDLNFD